MTEPMKLTKDAYIARENQYVARLYNPLPVVLCKGDGVWLWDTDGNKYLDFLSAYSAVSFGHLNKRIKQALLFGGQCLLDNSPHGRVGYAPGDGKQRWTERSIPRSTSGLG